MIPGKRYQVFSIRHQKFEKQNGNTEEKQLWIKAGSAFMNRDGSVNLYLDVLPLDGKLHVREAVVEERKSNNDSRTVTANGSSSQHPAMAAEGNSQFGGH